MATQNQNEIRNKAFMISSLMGNPKLSKIIADAWKAPVGSTKNDNARKILYSLNKVNSNYDNSKNDGQGGVADWVKQKFTDPLKNYVSSSFTTNSPANSVQTGMPQQGMQFLKSIDDKVKSQRRDADPNKYVLDASGNIIGLQPTALGKTGLARDVTSGLNVLSGAGQAISRVPGNIGSAVGSKVIMPGVDWLKKYTTEDPVLEKSYSNLINVDGEIRTKDGRKFGKGKTAEEAQAELSQYLGVAPNEIKWDQIGKMSSVEAQDITSSSTGATDTAPNYTGAPIVSGDSYTYINKDGTTHTGKIGDNYADNTVFKAPIGELPPPGDQPDYNYDPNDTIFNQLALTAPEGTQQRRAQDAYLAGMGKTAFTLQELSDPTALGLRLGVPKEIAATFPKIFLQDTIDEITSSLKKEYQIDELRNDLTAKINAGVTVEQDFTDYIRDKDEYLKKIDKPV